jgi:hypothetical protein
MEITHIEHIGIAVRNLEESIKYYEDILGMKCYAVEEVDEQKVKTAFFKVGDTLFISIFLHSLLKSFQACSDFKNENSNFKLHVKDSKNSQMVSSMAVRQLVERDFVSFIIVFINIS